VSITRAATFAVALALGCAATALPAAAATYRVDDSSSFPRESTALLRWRQTAPARDADDTLEGTVGVAVRLNLTPWLNQTGRVFLVFPEQGTPQVRVSWRTQGRLLPGEIAPGQRVLVYEGPITLPYLDETLALTIQASGGQLPEMRSLAFHFEIDTD
jgi:hypothetical protein